MVHYSKRTIRNRIKESSVIKSFQLNIASPLLQEDMDDIWDSLREKRNWTDLHHLLASPHDSSAQLKCRLDALLLRERAATDVNKKDCLGLTPLALAVESCPEAVDALLRAGANPHLLPDPILDCAARSHSWNAVRLLIHAGADVNARGRRYNDALWTPLHAVISAQFTRYGDRIRTAQELVYHGGHLLDWDARDRCGRTPLDVATWFAGENPEDEEAAALYELYRTRKLSPAPCLFDSPNSDHKGAEVANLTSMSLLEIGLKGDARAIGTLVDKGAMVNERDDAGRTLLHLVAMGKVPNGFTVATELVRHGGHSVDWDAVTADGQTAEDIAMKTLGELSAGHLEQERGRFKFSVLKNRLKRMIRGRPLRSLSTCYKVDCEEAARMLELFQRRTLPDHVDYIYPCMHPEYCRTCSSRTCHCSDGEHGYEQGMPGSWGWDD